MRQAQLSVMDFYVLCFSFFLEGNNNSGRHCQGIIHKGSNKKLHRQKMTEDTLDFPCTLAMADILGPPPPTVENILGFILHSISDRKLFTFHSGHSNGRQTVCILLCIFSLHSCQRKSWENNLARN